MKKYINKVFILCVVLGLLIPGSHAAQKPAAKIESIINAISQENVAGILKKLESFQTRNMLSSRREYLGIDAASEWIFEEFKKASPKLNVFFDTYELPPQGRRMTKDITLRNVVAVLPGKNTSGEERIFLVNAHLDTISRSADGRFHYDDVDTFASGVNDAGSGVAALLEMVRVFSAHEFEATIYFTAFSGGS